MKIDPRSLVLPLLAAFLLFLTLQRTMAALEDSGAWQEAHATASAAPNPYARLDAALGREHRELPAEGLRDPFGFGSTRPAGAPRTAAVSIPTRPVTPPPPPRPALTAIIWDESDPRATIHFNGRDFSVRENSLFADFTVRRISRTEVVLDRNGEATVLRMRARGE